MMPIFIVMVRRADQRYMDSIWCHQQHAVDRTAELAASLERNGLGPHSCWHVWWAEAVLADGKMA